MAALATERTTFSLDVFGRYVCNTFDEARASGPFDLIVVGGGTFGAALAHYLFGNDQARVHRILVLEGGPFLLSEHVQNLPLPGLGAPGAGEATSIADLRAAGADRTPRREVWGLAWHSSTRFIGLAYCVGGRSLYWGGWSPQPLDAELPTGAGAWPKPVVDDLHRYYPNTARQIGVDETNDFIYGDLHNALRKTLFDGLAANGVQHAVPFGELPDHPVLRNRPAATADELRALLGDANLPAGLPAQDLRDLLKVEAPLAVQAHTLPGLFPSNKFSPVPLLMRATRNAYAEAPNDDTRKRLMVVPDTHVNRLRVQDGRVVAVETNRGEVPLPAGGRVAVALGTIESARLALNSFTGVPGGGPIGANLMAHLRSNLTIRVARTNVPNLAAAPGALQAAALFVKGRYDGPGGAGPLRHFHLQITAAGLGPLGTDSEAELFQKIPDIDTIDRFTTASDTHVVVTIRGIGEMQPHNPNSFVRPDGETDTVFGDRRAFVQLQENAADTDLWTAMDTAADDVALLFAGGQPYQVRLADGTFATVAAGQPASQIAGIARHDGLGTTHHEAGTLWMGDSPANSVTDANARFHNIANAYAVGPAVQPTIGSPNPMLTGVALAHRLADHLVPVAPTLGEGPRVLFNGVDAAGWRMAGPGSFAESGRRPRRQPRRRPRPAVVHHTHPGELRPALRMAPHAGRRQLRRLHPLPEPEHQELHQPRLRAGPLRLRGPDRRERARPGRTHRRHLRRGQPAAQPAACAAARRGPVEQLRDPGAEPDLHRAPQRRPGHPVRQPTHRARQAEHARRAQLHRTTGPHRRGRVPQDHHRGHLTGQPPPGRAPATSL